MDNANPSAIKETAAMPDHASINPETRQLSGPPARNKHAWAMIGVLSILLQACATSPPVSPSEEAHTQAKIAYLLSDYQRTLAIVLPRAEAGEPWAQYTLGYMYYYGRGLAQDRQVAKRWIESAAAKGYAPAKQAMQRISAPPPRTGDENNDTSKQGSVGAGNTPVAPPVPANKEPSPAPTAALPAPEPSAAPTEQPKPPIGPPPAEPSTMRGIAPPVPTTEPSSAPIPTPPQPAKDATPAPAHETQQAPAPSQAPADPPPPQTSSPSSSAEPAVQPALAASPERGIKGREWLTRQDPRHFTLQLASSPDEAAIARIIRKQGIEQHAAYYATMQNGRTWYSLIYGSFSSRGAAHQAMRKLPRALRRDSPRIRSFREIRAQLNPPL